MSNNSLGIYGKYYLTFNDEDFVFDRIEAAEMQIMNYLNEHDGRLTLMADDGARPWWQRYLFGLKRFHRLLLSCEWSGDIAGLNLYDENSSEYRARPLARLENVAASSKAMIRFGEAQPIDDNFLVLKEDLKTAVKQFLASGVRPECFNYEFVE